MMRAWVRAMALAGLVSVAGCSLLVGTGDLSGGDAPAGDAGALDGPSGSEASSTTDAAVDVDANTPDAEPFQCVPGAHFLCADFDQGAVDEEWSSVETHGAGTLALDGEHVSAPWSALFKTDAVANAYAERRLERIIPATPKGVHVEMDLLLDPGVPVEGYVEILKVASNSMDGGGLQLGFYETGAYVNVELDDAVPPSNANFVASQNFPRGKWFHFTFDATLSANAGSLQMTVDGVTILDVKGIATYSPSGTRSFILGLWSSGTVPAMTMRADNVVVDLSP